MRRYFCLFMALVAFTGIACPPTPTETPKKKEAPVEDAPPPASLDALKPRLEAALQQVRDRDLLTTHGFWTVFHGILGMGPDKTMLRDPKTKDRFNAVEYICQGKEVRGMQFIPTRDGLDVATVAPDRFDLKQAIAQGHQDQFIAEMAQWGMDRKKKFRVGDVNYTFEDFIRHSKMRASTKKNPPQELSWAIIIVAQYYGTDHAWTNRDGDALRCEDIVRYELDASIEEAACGGTHRLFGLTWAYHLHLKNRGAKDGVWLDAEKKIAEYKQRAKTLQNGDGSFSTDYFKGPGRIPDTELRISTTGHIVEWLALAMTDEELRAGWMQHAVSSLSRMILETGDRPVDNGGLYHAAHGLHLYHERVFGRPAAYLPLLPGTKGSPE